MFNHYDPGKWINVNEFKEDSRKREIVIKSPYFLGGGKGWRVRLGHCESQEGNFKKIER